LEHRHLPYIVGINTFDGAFAYDISDVRHALSIDASVPIVRCDARDRTSVEQTLVTLYEHVSQPQPSLVHAGEAI
jgi:signal recognition particle receptor subunit beta